MDSFLAKGLNWKLEAKYNHSPEPAIDNSDDARSNESCELERDLPPLGPGRQDLPP